MVKVITIMDDVYAELYRMKKPKGMSFTEILRYLLKQSRKEGRELLGLAGSVDEQDIDRRVLHRMRSEQNGKNMFG